MFDSFYELSGLGNTSSPIKPNLRTKICKYRFCTPEINYILEVECYKFNFYVIQYYNRKYKNHPRKYQILTNEHKARPIIGTCMKVIQMFSEMDPLASFGFIGANSYDPITGKEEKIDSTKRWKIYKYAVENEYGPETFKHAINKLNSSYILLRRRNDMAPAKLLDNILTVVSEFYEKAAS